MSTIVIPIKILISSILLCFPGHALTALWLVSLAGFSEECIFESGVGKEISIHHSIDCIKHIEIKIKLLTRSLQLLYEDQQQVVGKLTDGLDAIASHEHGTKIIEAYA
ncbi:uncharacterized protein BT62DRAFT_919223 [Guyanagaster necrorhizus]|uniref:Uncharacterized protein n=1 Tax=Guyanagaster necrorhizus TaxID=856835 RepID=A0A9P7VTW3_9AGAR|nr:uncharacterized protein BT62DRAFT_919223 [Guyanagaster necrorhizus MCA 3950]KAG7447313.1 hypothetical protein BT62DRAFT_919223 [Guyanagaster necrorhizus MCA 3950]